MDLKVLWTIASSMGTVSDLNMLKNVKGFNIDIVAADTMDKDCPGFVVTGKKYKVPEGRDKNYIKSIFDICEKENITTIIPQYGNELVPLSQNKELFEKRGIKVLVTDDTEMLKIACNKWKLYDYLKDCDFIPHYKYVKDLSSLEKAVFDLGYPNVPVCIKPVDGEGSRGFRIITGEKLNVFNEKSGTVKIGWDIFKEQIEKSGHIPDLLAMEYLPGTEYSVDCVCKDGFSYICIPRQREETSMGVATVSVIEKNQEIIDLSKDIISRLHLSYNVNIQFKYSSSGKPRLIEINPRVSGSLVANCGAGVNMLELSLKAAYGLPVRNIKVKWGTRMMRYWDQIYI